MCLFRHRSIRDCDSKTRRIWACGQCALLLSLMPVFFASSFAGRHHGPLLLLRGVLLAITIVCFAWSARRMRNFGNRA